MGIVPKTLYWLTMGVAAAIATAATLLVFAALALFQLFRWAELKVAFNGDEAARTESKARYRNW